jgi:hypothetical protein
MTSIELDEMMNRMESFGGSFVVALAYAMRKADQSNKTRLILAFPEYVKEYGPESQFPAYE